MAKPRPESTREYLSRYPRLCAHVIAESLGYATPSVAAAIVKDAAEHRSNYCEWILSCYRGDARAAVDRAVRQRRHHRGYMADYHLALRIVRHEIETGEGPHFASCF